MAIPLPPGNPLDAVMSGAGDTVAPGGGTGGPSASNSMFSTSVSPFSGFNNSGWSVNFAPNGAASNNLSQPMTNTPSAPGGAAASSGMSSTTMMLLAGAGVLAFVLLK